MGRTHLHTLAATAAAAPAAAAAAAASVPRSAECSLKGDVDRIVVVVRLATIVHPRPHHVALAAAAAAAATAASTAATAATAAAAAAAAAAACVIMPTTHLPHAFGVQVHLQHALEIDAVLRLAV